MNKNSKFSKDVSAHAAGRHLVLSPLARWRRVFIALALALTVASAGQTPPAQAAPAGATEIRFSMIVRNLYEGAPICAGDNVPIHVKVMRAEVVGDHGGLGNAQYLPGVMVEATTSNAGVGTLNQNTIYTGLDSLYPGGAEFKFHADKAGTTTISFKGTINHIWWPAILGLPPLVDRKDFVNAQVVIAVEDCQYKVTAISHWVGWPPRQSWQASFVEAALKEDSPGHYTGTATMSWVTTINQPPRCSATVLTTTAQVDLTGVMDADGQHLVVGVTYPPVRDYEVTHQSSDCIGDSGSVDGLDIAAPLTFSVPASGGGQTLSQVLTYHTLWSYTGSANVTVIQVISH